MMPIRTAIIAVGNMSSDHASCIVQGRINGLTLSALCDIARYLRIEAEDDTTIFTRYPNGTTSVFLTSAGKHPRHQPSWNRWRQGPLRL